MHIYRTQMSTDTLYMYLQIHRFYMEGYSKIANKVATLLFIGEQTL